MAIAIADDLHLTYKVLLEHNMIIGLILIIQNNKRFILRRGVSRIKVQDSSLNAE
jgi:hypothetical protein